MENSTGIYDHSRKLIRSRYGDRIHGSSESLILGISHRGLSESAEGALVKSAQSLNWGGNAVAFARTDGLAPGELMELVEGLDPVAVVIADEESAQAFFLAYRIEATQAPAFRVLGREIRLVTRFESLMKTLNGKQQIWATLKTLPRA